MTGHMKWNDSYRLSRAAIHSGKARKDIFSLPSCPFIVPKSGKIEKYGPSRVSFPPKSRGKRNQSVSTSRPVPSVRTRRLKKNSGLM